MTYSTSYFRSKVAAIRYHLLFGFTRAHIQHLFDTGRIKVGQPPLRPWETLAIMEGGRYGTRHNMGRS